MNKCNIAIWSIVISGMISLIYFSEMYAEVKQNVEAIGAKRDIKVLVLIITSDDLPVYTELQKIWRSYMHRDREHFEVYFIRGNPDLLTTCEIEEEIIWSKSVENLIPGLLNKTILSLEAMLPRIKQEFDYVLRTNLSSFYIFPRLLKFLERCPRRNFYCGTDIGVRGIGSGCGFLMSPDIVQLLVDSKAYFLDNKTSYDDVVMGKFLKNKGVHLLPHERMDFYSLDDWYKKKDRISNTVFQFRIKNPEHLRLNNDVYIQSQLLQMFYH